MICSKKSLSQITNWIINGMMGSVKSLLTFPAYDLKILWDLGGYNAAIWLNFFLHQTLHLIKNVERNIPGMGKKYRRPCVLKCLISGLMGDVRSALHLYSSSLTCTGWGTWADRSPLYYTNSSWDHTGTFKLWELIQGKQHSIVRFWRLS